MNSNSRFRASRPASMVFPSLIYPIYTLLAVSASTFFRRLSARSNALRSDIIVVTGDIIDELTLLDWIPNALAELSAPLGVYFVLGNHDQFTGEAPRIRKQLTDSGFIDVGNSWRRLEIGRRGDNSRRQRTPLVRAGRRHDAMSAALPRRSAIPFIAVALARSIRLGFAQ